MAVIIGKVITEVALEPEREARVETPTGERLTPELVEQIVAKAVARVTELLARERDDPS